MINDPDAPFVMKFGKYKGSGLEDVPVSYLEWILATFKKDGLLKEKIREFLKESQ